MNIWQRFPLETANQLEREIHKTRATIARCKAKGFKHGAKAARFYLRELLNLRYTIRNHKEQHHA